MITLSYAKACGRLASIWDETIATCEPVAISRRGKKPIAVLPLEKLRNLEKEVSGLEETIYLLSSPANARRLLGALDDIKQGKVETMTMDELKRRVGLE